mmetsp:Transcript_4572/g.16920  ORF Transcript_4572/g.16920 Transcript_4572/m.16920 type:complete len:405 (+) Transcript_4572:1047-2261(+)
MQSCARPWRRSTCPRRSSTLRAPPGAPTPSRCGPCSTRGRRRRGRTEASSCSRVWPRAARTSELLSPQSTEVSSSSSAAEGRVLALPPSAGHSRAAPPLGRGRRRGPSASGARTTMLASSASRTLQNRLSLGISSQPSQSWSSNSGASSPLPTASGARPSARPAQRRPCSPGLVGPESASCRSARRGDRPQGARRRRRTPGGCDNDSHLVKRASPLSPSPGLVAAPVALCVSLAGSRRLGLRRRWSRRGGVERRGSDRHSDLGALAAQREREHVADGRGVDYGDDVCDCPHALGANSDDDVARQEPRYCGGRVRGDAADDDARRGGVGVGELELLRDVGRHLLQLKPNVRMVEPPPQRQLGRNAPRLRDGHREADALCVESRRRVDAHDSSELIAQRPARVARI